MPDELPLRAATGGDAAVLVRHRRLMYEDMHEAQGFEYPPGACIVAMRQAGHIAEKTVMVK